MPTGGAFWAGAEVFYNLKTKARHHVPVRGAEGGVFFEEAMFDDEAVKGVMYGIAIAVAIWLLAWVLGS